MQNNRTIFNPYIIVILIVLTSELIIYPINAFLQYGLGFNLNASYFLRFNYLIITFLGLCIILKKGSIVNLPIIKVFILFIFIASLKGVLLGNFYNFSNSGSNIFLSHLFYLSHPILSLTLGYNMYSLFFKNKYYFSLVSKLLKFSFKFGLALSFVFQIIYQLGLASYNSLDIWNIFYGGAYTLSISNSIILPFIVILNAIMLGKRVTILIALIFTVIYLLKKKLRKFLVYFIPVLLIISILGSNEVVNNIAGIKRLNETIESLSSNDLEGASAGRLLEATSALEIISSSNSNLLFGSGMGSFFYPWPEVAPNYKSHYTHFTPISYMWIGGIFLTFFVYFFLIRLTISLFKIKKLKNLTQTNLFQLMLPAILISSLTGAVLMNNSILWLIIGMSYKLVKEEKIANKAKIS